jgi:hypothetical protein
VRLAFTILLCLSLAGCAVLKDGWNDLMGHAVNVPTGFAITHECVFVDPPIAVVGFKVTADDGHVSYCGTVSLALDQASRMSRKELAEYLFVQFKSGTFKECKNESVQP